MKTPPGITTECALINTELDRHLGEQAFKPPAEIRRHLDACERCNRLYRWMTEPSASDPGSNALYSRIESSLKASLRPVKVQPSIRSLALRFWVILLFLAFAVIATIGADGLRQMEWSERVVVSVWLIGAGVLLSLSLAWQMTPGSRQLIPARITIAVLTAGFLFILGVLFPWRIPDAFLAPGWHCFKTGMAMAAPITILFVALSRRGAPLVIGSLAGTVSALAGLFGTAVLQFTCSRQEATHLVVWHGGVFVASILIGLVAAQPIRRRLRQRP